MALVYVHVFPNDKIYIGVTEKKKANDRWENGKGYKGQPRIFNAIKKYGWDNIQHIVLIDNISIDKAYECERFLIDKYNSTDHKYGYNAALGGEHSSGYHFNHTEEAKKKISRGHKGKLWTDERKKKFSELTKGRNKGCVSPMKGKHHTAEAKEKIRQANLGKPKSKETIQKLRESQLGRKRGPMSEEHKRKISEAIKSRKHKVEILIKVEVQ